MFVIAPLWKSGAILDLGFRHSVHHNFVSARKFEAKTRRLRNLVNVYTSSSNPNYSLYTNLPDWYFLLCWSVKTLKNVTCANIQNWLGVVIELISSDCKVIAICADSYINRIFFSCECVINELTPTRHNCQSSGTHQYTCRQEVNTQKKNSFKPCIYTCISKYKDSLKCRNIIAPSSVWVKRYSGHTWATGVILKELKKCSLS